jgi:hypothetical protein
MIALHHETPGVRAENGRGPALRAVEWLYLAAAPTFALMAILTAAAGGGTSSTLCSGMEPGSALTGMAPMYALMSLFHSAPWLRLILARPRR